MNTAELVLGLAEACGCRSGYRLVVGANTRKGVEALIESKNVYEFKPIDFLVLGGAMEYPIYAFWQLREAGVLASLCWVVFTNINENDLWADLERCYGGTRFGTLFLMRYKGSCRPPTLPSQRGMYMRG